MQDHILQEAGNIVNQSIGSQNDDITRKQISAQVDNYMNNMVQSNQIDEYRVVCDETNNSPTQAMNNEFHATVLVKPTKQAQHITITFDIEGDKRKVWVLQKEETSVHFTQERDGSISVKVIDDKGEEIPLNLQNKNKYTDPMMSARNLWRDFRKNGYTLRQE
jgi:hypothetical protein